MRKPPRRYTDKTPFAGCPANDTASRVGFRLAWMGAGYPVNANANAKQAFLACGGRSKYA